MFIWFSILIRYSQTQFQTIAIFVYAYIQLKLKLHQMGEQQQSSQPVDDAFLDGDLIECYSNRTIAVTLSSGIYDLVGGFYDAIPCDQTSLMAL